MRIRFIRSGYPTEKVTKSVKKCNFVWPIVSLESREGLGPVDYGVQIFCEGGRERHCKNSQIH